MTHEKEAELREMLIINSDKFMSDQEWDDRNIKKGVAEKALYLIEAQQLEIESLKLTCSADAIQSNEIIIQLQKDVGALAKTISWHLESEEKLMAENLQMKEKLERIKTRITSRLKLALKLLQQHLNN